MTPCTRKRFLSAPVLFMTALQFFPAAAFAENDRPADTAVHHFQIGYERGISLRYFPMRAWGIGLVASSSTLYLNDLDEREHTSSSDSFKQKYRENEKNISIALEGLRRIGLKRPFMLHLFASIGGSYSTYRRSSDTEQHYTYDSLSTIIPVTRNYSSFTEQTEIGCFGRIGIMPGLSWGIFNVAFRLGIEGRYSINRSPDDTTEKRTGKSSQVRFIYPAGLVESLILHFEI